MDRHPSSYRRVSVYEIGGRIDVNFFFLSFVYFAQEERNQMLQIKSQLVDTVLTREMQYNGALVRKCDAFCF